MSEIGKLKFSAALASFLKRDSVDGAWGLENLTLPLLSGEEKQRTALF